MASPYRDATDVRTVAVIGAGVIGAGWVAFYLSRGLAVRVADPAPDAEARVRAHVATSWPQLQRLGLSQNANPQALTFHATPEAAATTADFIQENAPERDDVKADLYRRLDAVTPPNVLIASSTSSFSVTKIQAGCKRPQRCVLGHPFNPVHLIPLVEVAGGAATDPLAVDAALALYRALGKHPVLLQHEIFGHIANRLASAMFREAVHLVNEGVTDVQGVDDVLRFGPALKWAIQGQFMTYNTSGGPGGMASFLEKYGPGQETRWRTLGNPSLTPDLKAKIVTQMSASMASRSEAEIAAEQDEKLLRMLMLLAHGPG